MTNNDVVLLHFNRPVHKGVTQRVFNLDTGQTIELR